MARLVDLRAAAIARLDDAPEPLAEPLEAEISDEEVAASTVDGAVREAKVDDADDWTFDDDDFWEALDMMETSDKMLSSFLTQCPMSPSRRREIENHCDDLKQFIDQFLAPTKEDVR